MKKKILLKILLPFIFSIFANANITVAVSVVPQLTIAKAIGGNKVNIIQMVPTGSSPHTYEPKPTQMKLLSNAKLYLPIGIEFEKAWLPKFKAQNKNMVVVDMSKNIKQKIQVDSCCESHHHHDEHHSIDSHIWTSTANIKILALNTYNALISNDPTNKKYYEQNYKLFLSKIVATDNKIRSILKSVPKNSKFMVFHPAWGYFASQYGLIQVAIEVDGKEPKPASLVKIMQIVKKDNIRAIFTQPEFSDKSARILADELQIPIIKISPLAPDLLTNLIKMASAIANSSLKK